MAEEKKTAAAEETTSTEKKATAKKADAKPAAEKKAPAKKADAKPAAEKKAPAKTADEKPAAEKKAPAKKADEKPADDKKAPAKKADAKADKKSGATVVVAAKAKKQTKADDAPKKGSVKITLKRALTGRKQTQIAVAHSLGLKRAGDVTFQPDNGATAGKIAKLAFLLDVRKA